MKKLFWMFGAACLVFCASASAPAQDDEIEGLESLEEQRQELPSMPQVRGPITIIRPAALLFTTFDSDRDYQISRAEASAGAIDAFKRADKDNNGRVSLFELEDWRAAALGSMDALPGNLNFDTDYDNQVSTVEFNKAIMDIYARHDKDEDGQMKNSELMQILEVPAPKGPKKERQTDRECLDQLQRNRSRF